MSKTNDQFIQVNKEDVKTAEEHLIITGVEQEISTRTLRDLRRPMELDQKELTELKHDLEKLIEKELTDETLDFLNNLIGIMREKFSIDKNYITNKELSGQFAKIKNTANKLSEMLNSNEMGYAYDKLMGSGDFFIQNKDPHNIPFHTAEYCDQLAKLCETETEKLKERKRDYEYSFNKTKQKLMCDFARELSTAYNVNISKYREGTFAACVKTLYQRINDKDQDIATYIPEDIFETIRLAADNFEKSEPFILLKFR